MQMVVWIYSQQRDAEFGSPAYAMASLGGWSTTQPVVLVCIVRMTGH